jgi:hypothetical protein
VMVYTLLETGPNIQVVCQTNWILRDTRQLTHRSNTSHNQKHTRVRAPSFSTFCIKIPKIAESLMQHLLHQDDTVPTHLCGAAIDCIIQLHPIACLHTNHDSRVATPAAPVQPLSKVGCLRTHAHGNSTVVMLL